MTQTILRLPEVMKRTGLCRSSIYALVKKSEFPEKVYISERTIGWLESEIEEWIQNIASKRLVSTIDTVNE